MEDHNRIELSPISKWASFRGSLTSKVSMIHISERCYLTSPTLPDYLKFRLAIVATVAMASSKTN